MLNDPLSPISEAYRTLRTNILHIAPENQVKTLLLTSAHPNEGKTVTIANLGIAMAETVGNVLLIDCDMRKPALHYAFGLEKENGLSDVLEKDVPWQEVIKETGIGNLSIMTSGYIPLNPSKLVSSHKAKELLNELKECFDIIVLDTSAVLAVTDASVLASIVDGVILVVLAQKTLRETAMRSVTLLNNVRANILGVILNGIPLSTRYGYYYYYHYKYNMPDS